MNNERQQQQQQQEQESWNGYVQTVTLLSVTIVQDNAAPLPNCMSKTTRSYLLRTFPDLATVSEETRWKSQLISSKSNVDVASIMSILPPQRQDSFSLSSHSTGSTSSMSTTSNSCAPQPINRRTFLVRQGSSFNLSHKDMSRLVRQTSLRRMELPRMPQRQDSVSFLF